MNNRVSWVDFGKGIGIILVVYGHLLSSGFHKGLNIPEHFFMLSDSIVYSFHMPLFFFLSGLFVESSFQKRGARGYFWDKFSPLAYAYLVWSILQVSVELIFSNQTQNGANLSDLLAIPYKPWGQFWFVYALLIMHIVYILFNNFGKYSTSLMFILACVLYFNPLLISAAGLFGFSVHFIFFISGIILKKRLMNINNKATPLWSVVLLFIILMGSEYFILENLLGPVRFTVGIQVHPFYFLYLAFLGIIFSICLSKYLSEKERFQFLQTLGVYSFQIFLVHMLAGVGARMILLYVFGIHNWVIHITVGVGFALIAPIILQKISDRVKFPYLFEFKRNYDTTSN